MTMWPVEAAAASSPKRSMAAHEPLGCFGLSQVAGSRDRLNSRPAGLEVLDQAGRRVAHDEVVPSVGQQTAEVGADIEPCR
jgi:hypothetical protein